MLYENERVVIVFFFLKWYISIAKANQKQPSMIPYKRTFWLHKVLLKTCNTAINRAEYIKQTATLLSHKHEESPLVVNRMVSKATTAPTNAPVSRNVHPCLWI